MKKRDYAAGSQKMAGNEQIAAEVGKNPNGVGYVGMAYLKAGGVKPCRLMAAVPSCQKRASAQLSLLATRHFIYTNRRFPEWPGGKDFVDFTVGPGGQRIVAQVGFVPIK